MPEEPFFVTVEMLTPATYGGREDPARVVEADFYDLAHDLHLLASDSITVGQLTLPPRPVFFHAGLHAVMPPGVFVYFQVGVANPADAVFVDPEGNADMAFMASNERGIRWDSEDRVYAITGGEMDWRISYRIAVDDTVGLEVGDAFPEFDMVRALVRFRT